MARRTIINKSARLNAMPVLNSMRIVVCLLVECGAVAGELGNRDSVMTATLAYCGYYIKDEIQNRVACKRKGNLIMHYASNTQMQFQ